MSIFNDVDEAVQGSGLTIHTGYAPTGAQLPYVVHRPLVLDVAQQAINGEALSWNQRTSLYACGASVEASYNLAIDLVRAIQGVYVAGTTLSTSLGYIGAQVEGHYETQVTVQLNQGGI